MPDFFDPTPEQQNVVLIAAAVLREAERLIESCEHCNPEGAEILFDNVLDRVTGSDPNGFVAFPNTRLKMPRRKRRRFANVRQNSVGIKCSSKQFERPQLSYIR
jgi:hypothetical protein